MHPSLIAKKFPDKPAVIMGRSSETRTYKELDDRSNQLAQLFRSLGLEIGDTIALCVENTPEFFEICWAAQRSGLYFVPISTRLGASEVRAILEDCEPKVILVSDQTGLSADELRVPAVEETLKALIAVGAETKGLLPYEHALRAMPTIPIDNETAGRDLLYSSGTTGQPKGIRLPLPGGAIDDPSLASGPTRGLFNFDGSSVYLSTAPLYHAAPLRYNMALQRAGATCVVMEKFDAHHSLQLIERHGVTHSQWVPTMFSRLLKLPEEIRGRYELGTMQAALHAAAPCPVPIKENMIDWWGPIVTEYYSGSEGAGFCSITAKEWLTHKGSVGRSLTGELHICDDDGNEVPIGTEGVVYFDSGAEFEYINDPEKTRGSFHANGWATFGDIGRVDKDGYLYLTDRKAFMIISGGVNIYPQESENVLFVHPKVADAAVIGVPNEEFGEEVKAVVEPVSWSDAGPALEKELIEFCRSKLSSIKCPRSVDFEKALPRHQTGKLYKKPLRDRYWTQHHANLV